jgi:protein-L-isoaspartate(D-aspartate) O-methyltransferase
MMVDGQVRTADVTDLRLLAAMETVARERFVAPDQAELAYLDRDVAVSGGEGRPARYLLKPMVLAKLIQEAGISDADRVLDVGCATGYSSAVLARLAGSVVALEEDRGLAAAAERGLAGVANVKVVSGPLVTGWPLEEPYDAIVMQGATEVVPDALLRQLKNGGRLLCILGAGPQRKATQYLRTDRETSGRPIFDAAAPLLPGFARKPAFVF